MPAASIRTFTTRECSEQVLAAIRGLMDRAFEGEFTEEDWDHTIGGRHVVVEDGGKIVAHASVVERRIEIGGRPFRTGYVEGVATSPDRQGRGFGTLAMKEIDTLLRDAFELGALATDRPPFYERLGWERWRGPSFVRRGSELVRTRTDDDALMVLRFGPSTHVDLAESISCETRPGDDW